MTFYIVVIYSILTTSKQCNSPRVRRAWLNAAWTGTLRLRLPRGALHAPIARSPASFEVPTGTVTSSAPPNFHALELPHEWIGTRYDIYKTSLDSTQHAPLYILPTLTSLAGIVGRRKNTEHYSNVDENNNNVRIDTSEIH